MSGPAVPKSVPDERVKELLPLLRQMVDARQIPCMDPGKVQLRLMDFTPGMPDEDKERYAKGAFDIRRMFEPHSIEQEVDDSGITLTVDRSIYEEGIKPRYRNEHADDRLRRLLSRAGYANIAEQLYRQALDAAVARFERSGDESHGGGVAR